MTGAMTKLLAKAGFGDNIPAGLVNILAVNSCLYLANACQLGFEDDAVEFLVARSSFANNDSSRDVADGSSYGSPKIKGDEITLGQPLSARNAVRHSSSVARGNNRLKGGSLGTEHGHLVLQLGGQFVLTYTRANDA